MLSRKRAKKICGKTLCAVWVDDPFDPDGKSALPIFRGVGVMPRFTGLIDPTLNVDG
jgi:hypothetical protein